MIQPKPIASLEPGKIYALRGRFRTAEDENAFLAHLNDRCPECKFLILPTGIEVVGSAPEELASAEIFTQPRTPPPPPPATQRCGEVRFARAVKSKDP